jgi:iron(III) transport system ATP-binding protein
MLRIENLHKSFTAHGRGRFAAVANVSVHVPPGRFFTMLGPSGCGNTTTLRCVAGLEHPDSGRITIDDVPVFDSATGTVVPTYRRAIGMVFQSYAIWPHMTAWENVEFPLTVGSRADRAPAPERRRLVSDALELMGMADFGKRPATQLSGGQPPRLALARAIVGKPKLLLLDEPLSNLDAKLRERMRFEIKRLQTELGITAIYVTHDQGEALGMSDEIAVMRDGVVVQQGTPDDIYNRPRSGFVADFVGSANLLPGTAAESVDSGEAVAVAFPDGTSIVGSATDKVAAGDAVALIVRAEAVRATPIARGAAPAAGELAGIVRSRVFLGESADLLVETLGRELRIRVSAEAPYAPGSGIGLQITPGRCLVLRDDRLQAAVGEAR